MATFLMILLFFVSLILMFIVLIQRGRGGGLAGALGGMGGQSAFGTKAGDVFTKITVVLAVSWVLLAGFGGMALRSKYGSGTSKYNDDGIIDESKLTEGESDPNSSPPIADGSGDSAEDSSKSTDGSSSGDATDGDSSSSTDAGTDADATSAIGETTKPAIPDSPELPDDPKNE